jgi:hypothetical protein
VVTEAFETENKRRCSIMTVFESNLSVDQKVGTTKTTTFSGDLDGNGRYEYSTKVYGAGLSGSFTVTITSPADGVFDSIEIKSSDGPDNKYTNVHTGDTISGELHSSLLHKTTLSLSVYSSTLKNTTVSGSVTYTY